MRRLGVLALWISLIAAPAFAEPSLWVVRRGQGTLYMFGTIHLLPPGLSWRSPQLDRALKASTELWTEVPVPVGADGAISNEAIQQTRRLIQDLGLQSGPPLSSRLTLEEAAAMRAIAAQGGVPPGALERMRPWFAATTLTGVNNNRLGWSSAGAPDVAITAEARASGKTFGAFETADQQLRLLADAPPEMELTYLRQTIALSKDTEARFAAVARLWASGDDDGMDALVNGAMRSVGPGFYERIVAGRNRAWLPAIVGLTERPGVKFLAVGDGHLVGPDGLVALLRARGIKVERVTR